MYGGEHQGTNDNEGDAFAVFVVDEAEKRCHQDGAERGNRREETGEVGIDAVFHDHQFRGEFQEWRNGRVEKHAEKRNEPETRVVEGDTDVGEAEFVIGAS